MEAGTMLGSIIGILIATILYGIVIYVVGKLKLGIEVNNFGTAFVAAFLIALITVMLEYFHIISADAGGGWGLHLLRLIVSALVIMLVGSMLKGMVTKGFLGAIVAALAITAVGWLLGMVLGSVMK